MKNQPINIKRLRKRREKYTKFQFGSLKGSSGLSI